ncbi:hypothetical protein HPP92_006613 [Vanilla planifolia]|uniref:Uncharacterized protein n=1 Tax=Vanilla planifolia TaxID=51239 RepID=A0A835RK80_VANPL|nr:hypothetical protein HPP92_006877 [Vanilla planifolia]KAG0489750.1 hypothetical protein HPP92_006613 [Vanilla planifolia]
MLNDRVAINGDGALPASEEFRQSPCTQDTPKQGAEVSSLTSCLTSSTKFSLDTLLSPKAPQGSLEFGFILRVVDLRRQDESIEGSCPKGELYQTMAGSGKDYCDSYS